MSGQNAQSLLAFLPEVEGDERADAALQAAVAEAIRDIDLAVDAAAVDPQT